MKWAIGTVVVGALVLLIALGFFLIILAAILFAQSRPRSSKEPRATKPEPAALPGPPSSRPVKHVPTARPLDGEIGFADEDDEEFRATVVMLGSGAKAWAADDVDGEARTEVLQRWHVEEETTTEGPAADYGLLDD